MIAQISRRATYDIIRISEAEFVRTENGTMGIEDHVYLETNDDKHLMLSDGTAVYGVEDFSTEQIIAIANGVEICGTCHKKHQVLPGFPKLMHTCECKGADERPIKIQGFEITFKEGGWGYIPIIKGTALSESFGSIEGAVRRLSECNIERELGYAVARDARENMSDE